MRAGGARLDEEGEGEATPEAAGASASALSAATRRTAQLSACWRVQNSTRSSPESAPPAASWSPDNASRATAPPAPPSAAGPPRHSSAKEAARAPSCSTAAAAAAAGEESLTLGDPPAAAAPPRCSASIASTRHAHARPSSVPSANAQGPALRSPKEGRPVKPPCSRRSLSRLLSKGNDDSEGQRPGRPSAEGRGRCIA